MAAFNLPNLRGDINSARDLKELKNYLFMLVENLEFTLNNLDEENLSTAYNEKSGLSATEAATVAKQAAAEAQAVAVQLGKTMVPSKSIIASINSSLETERIHSDRVATAASGGGIVLLGADSTGKIVPCVAEIYGDTEEGFYIEITAKG